MVHDHGVIKMQASVVADFLNVLETMPHLQDQDLEDTLLYLILLELKAGIMPLRISRQYSSEGEVNMLLLPPA